jgi:hypothetical protein
VRSPVGRLNLTNACSPKEWSSLGRGAGASRPHIFWIGRNVCIGFNFAAIATVRHAEAHSWGGVWREQINGIEAGS